MRKRLTAVILAVLVFSLIAASAASLGGIAVDGGVGSDDVVVNAACDTNDAADATSGENLAADFSTAWNGSNFVIAQVVIKGIDDACLGQDITIALTQGGTVQNWAPVTLTANGGSNEHTSTFSSVTAIDAELAFTLHVTIAS